MIKNILFSKISEYGIVKIVDDGQDKILYINSRDEARLGNGVVSDYSEKKMVDYILEDKKQYSRVLCVGLGIGNTLRSILEFDVQKVDVIDINKTVIMAAKQFFDISDNRINIIEGDAFNYIRDTEVIYDAIIIDVENPAIKHSASIYTKEFFEMVKLKVNGPVGLWAYSKNFKCEGIMYQTLKSVFTNVGYKVWENYIFVASEFPLNENLTIEPLIGDVNTLQNNILFNYFKKWQ